MRLAAAWQSHGRVTRLRPELVERGTLRPILLDDDATSFSKDCTTIAFVGAPSANFIVRFLIPERPGSSLGLLPEASIAGAAQITRCGARKAALAGLILEMRSPRGVLETVIARTSGPPPPLRSILADRDPGPIVAVADPGLRPPTSAISERARLFEARARREGALAVSRSSVGSDPTGSGEIVLHHEAGCERISVLGVPDPPHAQRSIDIDAELVGPESRDPIASDLSDSPDAVLEKCDGDKTVSKLRFTGSLPGVPVVVMRASWPLPQGLPVDWGSGPRGSMVSALGIAQTRALAPGPVYESLGVAGITALPVPVEAGACYLVGVTAIRGNPLGVGIQATLPALAAQNQSGPGSSGTSLSFCAMSDEPALLEVDTRGTGLIWLLAVWQTALLPVGEVHE